MASTILRLHEDALTAQGMTNRHCATQRVAQTKSAPISERRIEKLSWLPVSYFGDLISGEMTLGTWLDEAVSLGLNAVDVSINFFRNSGAWSLSEFRREIECRDLDVVVCNLYSDLTHPDVEQREVELRKLELDITTAAQAGAKMVRITAGQAHPELSRDTGIELVVAGLTQAALVAQESGVRAVFENHSKPGVWKYSDFAHPADVFLEIAERLQPAPIGILFDTANAYARGDNPMTILEAIVDRVECVHLADTSTHGSLHPTVIGTGVVDFETIFAHLAKHNYNGWFSVEEASGTGRFGIAEAINFFNNIGD